MTLWLEACTGLAVHDQQAVYVRNELKAPYLCFFHFQLEAGQIMSMPGSASRDGLALLEYLNTATANIRQEAEEMFAVGKVSAELMPYLFKPGALVCFEENGTFVVSLQTSMLATWFEDPDPDLQYKIYELSAVRTAFDGTFRRLSASKHRIDFGSVGGQPLNISDLSVQPLSCIPDNRRLELIRRGQIFMKCQRQLYVTYPSRGGQHDFVSRYGGPSVSSCNASKD